MIRKFDPTQTERWLDEAHSIIDAVGLVMANERDNLTSDDVYDLVERIDRAKNLLLVIGDRKYLTERAQEVA